MATSDALLVSRARSGDANAYAILLSRHEARLHRACRNALGDDVAAKDVAQEAALVAWLQLDRLRDPAHFGAWLTGIGRHLALSAARERSAHGRRLLEAGALRERAGPEADEPARRLLARERAADLAAAISILPPGQRDAVVLFHLAGLPQDTVASRLDTGVGAIRTRLHKARAALRELLIDHQEEPVPDTSTMPARISDVRRSPAGRHIVLVAAGEREVPIWIGAPDAEALADAMHDVERPRPATHVLALNLVRACGRAPQRVRITRLADEIFYAEVVLDDGTAVDARPSDALLLAVTAGVPIEIERAVLSATEDPLPEPYAEDLAAASQVPWGARTPRGGESS